MRSKRGGDIGVKMITAFIYSVTGAAVLYSVIGVVAPEGKTKKLASFIISATAVLIIAGAVGKAVFNGSEAYDFVFSSEYSDVFDKYSCDNEGLRVCVANAYISRAKKAFLSEGLLLENAGVSFGENNDGVLPEKFIINCGDVVIIDENEHINIALKSKACLNRLFGGEKIEIVINE